MAYVRRRLLKDGKTVVYLAMWREHAQGKELSRSFERERVGGRPAARAPR